MNNTCLNCLYIFKRNSRHHAGLAVTFGHNAHTRLAEKLRRSHEHKAGVEDRAHAIAGSEALFQAFASDAAGASKVQNCAKYLQASGDTRSVLDSQAHTHTAMSTYHGSPLENSPCCKFATITCPSVCPLPTKPAQFRVFFRATTPPF